MVKKSNVRLSFKTSRAIDEILDKILNESNLKSMFISKSALIEFLVIQGLEHCKLVHQSKNEEKEGE